MGDNHATSVPSIGTLGSKRAFPLASINMPSAAARRMYEDQLPSFMSVFDVDEEVIDDRTVTVVDPKLMEMAQAKMAVADTQTQLQPQGLSADGSHKHKDSTSTQNSESADSSPITTASLTSSLSDQSPDSSPESPVTLMPLSTFPTLPFGGMAPMGSLNVSETQLDRPLTSPNPRKKNMKGLSIQPPSSNGAANAAVLSEPTSPSFIKPVIPIMKRKPSQLSLKTNTNDLIQKTTLEIPQSPALPPILQRRALKHSTSSPHILSSLKSAGLGPMGGMTIPTVLERNESGLSEILRPSKAPQLGGFDSTILEEDSPIRTQIANRAAYEFEPFHEVENNEDQKTPGYPDGPIAIYGDNVFLYLEPTADEAAKFDVVINVAREVLNPFKALSTSLAEGPRKQQQSPVKASPFPDTAVTNVSYSTAFEFFPEDAAATPTTPKAVAPFREPEYIHMPWDHNTDIGADLMDLCETIDRKTKEGKKVLVHCQQGASRSASLIIAYGLFLNPELSVNDAYHAAQAKSRWISPNMRLMYCLQDFQKEVSRRRQPSSSAFRPRAGRSPTGKHRATLSADAIDIPGKEPLTAPLPAEESAGRSNSPDESPLRLRPSATPGRADPVSAGPSSAPSSFSWIDLGERGEKQSSENLNVSSPPRQHPQTSLGLAPVPYSRPMISPEPEPRRGRPRDYGFEPFGFDVTPAKVQPARAAAAAAAAAAALPPPPPRRAPPPPPLPMAAPPARERTITVMRTFAADDMALMSPRIEAMANNPFKMPSPTTGFPGMSFLEVPPTPSQGLFSPREGMFPREPFRQSFAKPARFADPRSPPTKGEAPIVRSIDEII
jgi:tyrosine-protein phosphatase MSG5